MSVPAVTVLIDTYNYAEYIEEAIASVVSQDFPAMEREILVIDDGSTDDTEQRVRKFGNAIQYFRKPNGGQASALNFGLAHARGEIVALLDADDYWLPGKLRRVMEEFDRQPEVGMVYHKLRQWDASRSRHKDGGLALLSGSIPSRRKDLLSYVLYPTSFLAFRRKTLEPLLPIPYELTTQADAHLSGLIIFLAPIASIPECLAVYRIHGKNLFAYGSDASRQQYEARMKTREILVSGMRSWLMRRGYDLSRGDLRILFKQWKLKQDSEAFNVRPPGRLKTFGYLLDYARYYGPQLTWRHRVVTYLNAVGSLFVGYKNIHRLDEWRVAVKRGFRVLSRQW